MANKGLHSHDDLEGTAQAEVPESPAALEKQSRFSKVLGVLTSKAFLVIVLVALLSGQCAALIYYKAGSPAAASERLDEVSLGRFRFTASPNAGGDIVGASFSLYVVLADQVEQVARPRLAAHKARVRQNIEELLRKAHGSDFEDPTLTELKRLVEERVNATLGLRAVSDVVIVELDIRRQATGSSCRGQTAKGADSTAANPGS